MVFVTHPVLHPRRGKVGSDLYYDCCFSVLLLLLSRCYYYRCIFYRLVPPKEEDSFYSETLKTTPVISPDFSHGHFVMDCISSVNTIHREDVHACFNLDWEAVVMGISFMSSSFFRFATIEFDCSPPLGLGDEPFLLLTWGAKTFSSCPCCCCCFLLWILTLLTVSAESDFISSSSRSELSEIQSEVLLQTLPKS